jgi:hypothetical protein
MKNDATIVMIIFLTVFAAALVLKADIFKKTSQVIATQTIESTGDPLLDQIYADHPDLDPRR